MDDQGTENDKLERTWHTLRVTRNMMMIEIISIKNLNGVEKNLLRRQLLYSKHKCELSYISGDFLKFSQIVKASFLFVTISDYFFLLHVWIFKMQSKPNFPINDKQVRKRFSKVQLRHKVSLKPKNTVISCVFHFSYIIFLMIKT